jgi:hypothetical protein
VASKTVVTQSAAARNGLFVFLETAFVLAFVRGWFGARTTTGRIVGALFMGGVVILLSLLWRRASKIRSWLEVTDDAIALCTHAAPGAVAITRADGDHVRFVMRGNARSPQLALTAPATGRVLPLPWYSKKPISTACASHGWTVEG